MRPSVRGKADNDRLGFAADDHVRTPRRVTLHAAGGAPWRVADLSVGALCVLAVTTDGEVLSWGRSERGKTTAHLMGGVTSIVGAVCGPGLVRGRGRGRGRGMAVKRVRRVYQPTVFIEQ